MSTSEIPAPSPAAGSGRGARRRGRLNLPRVSILAIALLIAISGLHVLLSGGDWYLPVAALVVLALAAVTSARALGIRHGLAPLAALVVVGIGFVVGFAPATTSFAIIPTPATGARFVELTQSGLASIAGQAVPATPDVGIVFLVAVLAVAVALLAEAFAIGLQRPAVAVLPVLAVLAVPVAVRAELADPVVFVATAIGLLLLIRLPRPRSTGPATVMIAVAAVAASLIVPPIAIPDDDGPANRAGYSTGLNPLVSLGNDLRRDEPIEALRYRADDGAGLYLRISALPVFSGQSWQMGALSEAGTVGTDPIPGPPGLSDEVERRAGTVSLELGAISSRWLPVPYPLTGIEGLEGDWFWNRTGLTVRTTSGNVYGASYTADYLQLSPTVEELRAAPAPLIDVSRELELPDEMPPSIGEIAREAIGEAATDYDRAVALQRYLRSPDFSYSTETPLQLGYDGADLDVIEAFLRERSGYCVHFAATMAVMARTLDIPSRLVVGFQPGVELEDDDAGGADGDSGSPGEDVDDDRPVYVVTTHELHAWPELYFEGVGWTRFEPTPSRGVPPSFFDPEAPPVTGPDGTPITPGTPNDRPDIPRDPEGPRPSSSPSIGPGVGSEPGATALPLVFAFALAALLMAAVSPAIWRALRRERRFSRIRRGRVDEAWAELRDTARDVGWSAPDTETPRALTRRLVMVLPAIGPLLDRVRDAVESYAYGAGRAEGVDAAAVRTVRRAILASASRRQRIRALLLPPSLSGSSEDPPREAGGP